MAALNITHEMLQQTERADRGSEDADNDIQRLVGKVDDTLSLYRQIEIWARRPAPPARVTAFAL